MRITKRKRIKLLEDENKRLIGELDAEKKENADLTDRLGALGGAIESLNKEKGALSEEKLLLEKKLADALDARLRDEQSIGVLRESLKNEKKKSKKLRADLKSAKSLQKTANEQNVSLKERSDRDAKYIAKLKRLLEIDKKAIESVYESVKAASVFYKEDDYFRSKINECLNAIYKRNEEVINVDKK